MMILVLAIEQMAPSVYKVHYTDHGGIEVSDPTEHGSICEALAYCGENISAEFAQFVEVQYGWVNSGTTAVARLRTEAHQLANELVAMMAKVAQV